MTQEGKKSVRKTARGQGQIGEHWKEDQIIWHSSKHWGTNSVPKMIEKTVCEAGKGSSDLWKWNQIHENISHIKNMLFTVIITTFSLNKHVWYIKFLQVKHFQRTRVGKVVWLEPGTTS